MPTTTHTLTLEDGRVLTWQHVRRQQAMQTPEDYTTGGKIDGEPISDPELWKIIGY